MKINPQDMIEEKTSKSWAWEDLVAIVLTHLVVVDNNSHLHMKGNHPAAAAAGLGGGFPRWFEFNF